MQDLNDLFYFAQVVIHGGFAPAGRALDIPKSKLSRRVAALEERLGIRLIQRTSRRFMVTELGQEYFRHCQALLVEAEAAQEVVDRVHAEPRGIVRLSCPPALLYFQVGNMVARFMTQCPGVQVHMEVTNRNVDLLGEGFDLALRVRFPPLEDTDLVMKVLAVSTQRLVGHPQLFKTQVPPKTPAELSSLPTIGLGNAEQQHAWTLDGPDGAVTKVTHAPRLIVNDMVGVQSAVLEGVGFAPLPLMMVHEHLQRGTLIDVLPGWHPRSGVVHAIFPSRRGLLPAVRKLVDFLADEFALLIDTDKGYEKPGTTK
jgi:DNA-binding transcriptional LysR family regulator